MPSKTFSVNFETSGFRRASRKMNQISDEADDMGSSFDTASKVGAAAVGAIVSGATAATAAVAKLTDNATEYARQVQNAQEQSGIAAERIQEIAHAAKQTSGASFDTVRDGLKELAIRSKEAANGTGEATEAFKELGISQQFLEDASTAETFRRVREELQGASNRMRTFAAETIFGGEAGEKLVQTLGLSSEEMQKLSQQARATGQVMTGEQVQALEKTRKAWTRIWGTVKGFGRSLAVAVLPIVQRLTPIIQSSLMRLRQLTQGVDSDSLGRSFDAALGYVRTFWQGTKEAANGVLRIWRSFVDDVSRVWDEWGTFLVEQGKGTWENVISLLRGAFGVVTGLWDTLIGTLTGNWSRAWEGIKGVVTSAALTIAQAIVGLVESILNTLAKLTSYLPGVGGAISSGLESARQTVEDFRESIQQANKEASNLQDTWSGFAGGNFGGGGAGGFFSSTDSDSSRPDTGSGGVGGGGPSGSGGSAGGERQGFFSSEVWRRTATWIQNAREEVSVFGTIADGAMKIANGGVRQLNSGLSSAITRASSVGGAFTKMGKQVVNALEGMIAKLTTAVALSGVLSATGIGGALNIGSSFTGIFGEIVGLDSGGMILSDGVAKVHKGEAVVNEQMMQNMAPATARRAQPRGGNLSASISMDELIFQLDRALKNKGQQGLIIS